MTEALTALEVGCAKLPGRVTSAGEHWALPTGREVAGRRPAALGFWARIWLGDGRQGREAPVKREVRVLLVRNRSIHAFRRPPQDGVYGALVQRLAHSECQGNVFACSRISNIFRVPVCTRVWGRRSLLSQSLPSCVRMELTITLKYL